jgi:hypothetical protein
VLTSSKRKGGLARFPEAPSFDLDLFVFKYTDSAGSKDGKMVMIFMDAEFTGLDQVKPDLISIGLVDEAGHEFYAELPPSHYAVQCNEWVHFNVLPHLWGGKYVQSVAEIRSRLRTWISRIQEQAVIVNDCPDSDFRLLLWLLPDWPQNLDLEPILFTAWAMGVDAQPELEARMARYHTGDRPAHHALHDAHSLRIGAMYARENGWNYKLLQ